MKTLMKLYYDPAGDAGAAAAVVEPPAGAAPANLTPGSASATVDINKADPPPPAEFVVPDAYKEKPYLKGVKGIDDVYKMLDGAQTLIGQKGPALPKADAPATEWDAYYESLGRPKTAAEYTPVLTGADKTDPKLLPRLQGAFHKAGLRPDQAKIIWDESAQAFQDIAKEQGIINQQADTDFDKLATDTFGADRDRILASSKAILDANVSANMKPQIAKLSNENLIVLADVLNNINKKYIKQDGPGSQPTVSGSSPDELRAKARGLMSEQSKHDPMSVEFQNLQKQINDIYDSIRRGTK